MSVSLERFPYVNVESLEYLNLYCCSSLEKFPEIHGRMKPELEITMTGSGIRELPSSFIDHQQAVLTELHLCDMNKLVSLPSSIFKLKCLVELDVSRCSKLESLPEEVGDLENLVYLLASMTLISRLPSSIVRLNKLKGLELYHCNLIDGGLPDDIGSLSSLKKLDLSGNNFEHLPRSIAQLGALKCLDLSNCIRLTQLPEEIGDLENLKYLNASATLISRPSYSIVQLNKLKVLNLSCCNLIDGGLPKDIGSLSSLEQLDLHGNDFEHLPQSIAQLGALLSLDLEYCKRLKELPEFPQQLHTITAEWSNDSICNSLFQNISSLQHDITASHSLSLRVFTSGWYKIPSWFHHRGTGTSVSVNLPENWYVSDNFLGFAVCYSGKLIDITAHLIPLCDDEMTQKFSLSNHSEYPNLDAKHFFLVPFAGLWDASNANGKTPNDYEIISLVFGESKEFGVRLLYKDEPELQFGIRRSRDEEASSTSSKKQRPLLQLFPTTPGL